MNLIKGNSIIFLLFLSISFLAQNNSKEYYDFVGKAEILYKAKDYKNSAVAYSLAFKANGWKGISEDRYNAACSWALANFIDSAFFQLNRIATKGNFADYTRVTTDADLNLLHDDKRWQPLLEIIKQNKEKAEIGLNKPLLHQLENILYKDQVYRNQIEEIEKKYGFDSKEIKNIWLTINKTDAENLTQVKSILDMYGWLGPDVVGEQGNSTLFLVIQHSDQKTQEKYLPMMREAVKQGKAHASDLALLEDRVALGQGKKQIYGSQISQDPNTGKYAVSPIEDEINVNKRRAEVGLEPIEEYVKHWDIVYKPGISTMPSSFWNTYLIEILLCSTVLVFLLGVMVIYKKTKVELFYSAWFWFYFIAITLCLYNWFTEAKNFGRLAGHSPVISLLDNLTNIVLIFIVIYFVNLILSKIFKRKHLIFELISISSSFSLFMLLSAKLIHKLYFPNSHITFFFNVFGILIPLGIFLAVKLILFLRQKAIKPSNLVDKREGQ